MAGQPTDEMIKEAIVSLAGKYWSEGRVLLLAQVGQVLRRQGIDLRETLGSRKLSAFLSEDLSDRLRLVTSPSDPLVQAVIPSDADTVRDIGHYFRRPIKNTTDESASSESSVKRFDRGFWLAFSRAIEPGYKRIVSVDPGIRFVDLPQDATSGGLEILATDIPGMDGISKLERDSLIVEKIDAWLTRNGVPVEAVLEKPKESRVERHGNESLLTLLLGALNDDDRRRVSMPLDIINKLHGKSAKP